MKTLIALITLLIGTQANAIYNPSWERPILKANMKIVEARLGFEKLEGMTFYLTKRDGQRQPTGLNVSYIDAAGRTVNHKLVINSIEKDPCGSTVYQANLPQEDGEARINDLGARFHVSLQDNTYRLCDDLVAGIWVAQVREGFGFCGTFDATATLVGKPEAVMTIQKIKLPRMDPH